MRCEKHGLATAADGQCVLCRRERGAPVGSVAQPRGLPAHDVTWVRPNALLLVLFAAMTALFLASRSLAGLPPMAPAPAAPAVVERSLEAQEEPSTERGMPDEDDPVGSMQDRFDKYDRAAANEEAPDSPKAAVARVQIEMYYATWCGACKMARAWFRDHDIRYAGYDIDRDPAAQRRLRELNPSGGIPVIVVDGEVMVGFNPIVLDQMIQRAAVARYRNGMR